jgi:hypothetical protein
LCWSRVRFQGFQGSAHHVPTTTTTATPTHPHSQTNTQTNKQAGPVAFPRLLTGEPVGAWCSRLVAGCGVLLLPADVYEHQPSAERGHFRFGLGRTDMPACLRVLDEWLVKEHGEP